MLHSSSYLALLCYAFLHLACELKIRNILRKFKFKKKFFDTLLCF